MESVEKSAQRSELLRQLPPVDEVVGRLRPLEGNGASDAFLTGAVRQGIEMVRARILRGAPGEPGEEVPAAGAEQRAYLSEAVLREARALIARDRRPHLRPVINATGVVLHTNLGRAPLGEAACAALLGVSGGYANLEFDLETGRRGHRAAGVEALLRRLTGAEAGLVVNNNAAAVMFAIRVMAEGREAVVSRGELIEIGGSFRIPDIMRQSGARLVEVGTTNKTRIGDYEGAIGPETGLLFKAHTSNFRIVGFTEEVPRAELAALGARAGLPVLEDLGSGCLVEIPGLPPEPTVADSVAAGVDVVTFSGDKLLGGPQAGVVVGKARWLDKMKTHPLMRVLRLDKLTLAALEATLRAYLDPGAALREIPVLRMLSEAPGAVRLRCAALIEALGEAAGRLGAEVVETRARVGGGAMPLAEKESHAVRLAVGAVGAMEAEGGGAADAAAARLRESDPPVIARIQEDQVLLDMLCVREEEIPLLARAVRSLSRPA